MKNVFGLKGDEVANAALAFMIDDFEKELDCSAERSRVTQRCVQHLMIKHGVPIDRASNEASKALAQLRHTGDAWINIDTSTSYCVMLRVKPNVEVMLSADQLLGVLRNYYHFDI